MGFSLVDIGFEDLRKVQLHEKNQPSLFVLHDDFFKAFKQFLEQQKERLERDFSVESASAYQNAQKIMKEILRRREKKVFLKALNDFQIGQVDSQGLAAEEKELYTSLVKIISEYEAVFAPSRPAKSGVARQEDDLVEIRVLAELPAFVGSRSSLGPFTASQTVRVPKEDAKLLVEQGAAQEVEKKA